MPRPLQSFRATEDIPELGVEPGDWVSVDLSDPRPVCIVKPYCAVATVREYLDRTNEVFAGRLTLVR